ncbi:MAG: ATP-binding protein [Betaproteobacteria bacterium]|nr:MAG: ATP-binding protein [Betaproteobacteria bacterium]
MLARPVIEHRLERALARSRAVALLGPRQVGKTTLAHRFAANAGINYFDLEDPAALARLTEPMTALRPLRGLVVIDEIQRRPELFPALRVLIDRMPAPAKFLILGSAAPALLRQASESLAGRIEIVELPGIAVHEFGAGRIDELWLRGGLPLSVTAACDEDSLAWRRSYIRLLFERDLPQLGIGSAAPTLLRFWNMLAHVHANVWNAADPARSLGVSETSVRRYLDQLTGAYLVRQLQPWHENLAKRQVKAPKIYFRDSGLLHALLGIGEHAALAVHPRLGASWEGFALEETLKFAQPDEAYFWATHAGAELDLLMIKHARRVGVEFKHADAPRITPSMRIAIQDLRLDALYVVYPGPLRYRLDESIEAVPIAELAQAPPWI